MDLPLLFIVLLAIVGCIGLALVMIGYLVSMATAFGNKHWVWAIVMLLFSPLALPYCFTHREITNWPRGLLVKGLAAIVLAVVLAVILLPSQVPSSPSSEDRYPALRSSSPQSAAANEQH